MSGYGAADPADGSCLKARLASTQRTFGQVIAGRTVSPACTRKRSSATCVEVVMVPEASLCQPLYFVTVIGCPTPRIALNAASAAVLSVARARDHQEKISVLPTWPIENCASTGKFVWPKPPPR